MALLTLGRLAPVIPSTIHFNLAFAALFRLKAKLGAWQVRLETQENLENAQNRSFVIWAPTWLVALGGLFYGYSGRVVGTFASQWVPKSIIYAKDGKKQ